MQDELVKNNRTNLQTNGLYLSFKEEGITDEVYKFNTTLFLAVEYNKVELIKALIEQRGRYAISK